MQYAAYTDDFIYAIGADQTAARTEGAAFINLVFPDKTQEARDAMIGKLQVAPISPHLARLIEGAHEHHTPFKLRDGKLVYDHDVAEGQKAEAGEDDDRLLDPEE